MNDLNISDKTTLRELQYRCYVTQQYFQNINLTVHHQSDKEKKPYPGDILCDQTFTNKEEFPVHYPIHTGEENYSCNVCHKSFTYKSRLIDHLRTHTGEKPNSCDVCHKLFSSRYYCLKVHRRTHTGENNR